MYAQLRRLTPFLLIFFTIAFVEAGITAHYADARSRGGGRSFKRTAPKQTTPQKAPTQMNNKKSGFGRGLAGGLIGGALGGLLLGSMFGMGGSGVGILPFILLAAVGYFLYRRMAARPKESVGHGNHPPPSQSSFFDMNSQTGSDQYSSPVPPVPTAANTLESGFDEIRAHDKDFDPINFTEIASDVFFQIQAGWMRRDLDSYRHLLGNDLANEYAQHFSEMQQKGLINKLESIAIRKVEIVDAGNVDNEDFVTILFTANLLDYTVDQKTGDVVEGSMTKPVKFAEKWTWARPVKTNDWKLEEIKVVD
ncbi:MAG: Tim44 domain-containing protein [Desulfobulbaceae bacterium]|nr:Tim44 domain-containing protein [Desulfobulbaceae bacterium]